MMRCHSSTDIGMDLHARDDLSDFKCLRIHVYIYNCKSVARASLDLLKYF